MRRKLRQLCYLVVGKSFWIEDEPNVWCFRRRDVLQSCLTYLCSNFIAIYGTFLDRGHGNLRGDRERILPFMQKPGLLTANEHPAFRTVEPMRAGMIHLIGAVLWCSINIVTDKPPQSW